MAAYLFEMGPSISGGPLTHGEIESWQRNTGIDLDQWEARTIRSLSAEYLRQQHESAARDCPAPWTSEIIIEQSRTVVVNKLRGYFSNSKLTRE